MGKRKRMQINQEELESEFCCVRALYFPRFDKQRKWRAMLRSDVGFHFKVSDVSGDLGRAYINVAVGRCSGLCDRNRNLIVVADNLETPEEMTVTLIHEIVHAIAGGHNSRAWKPRMEKAIQAAERFGHFQIAESLREDMRKDGRLV